MLCKSKQYFRAWHLISRYGKVEAVTPAPWLIQSPKWRRPQCYSRGEGHFTFLQKSILIFQFDENELADHKEASETGINPYPIYAAVDKDKLKDDDQKFPGKIWAPSLTVS